MIRTKEAEREGAKRYETIFIENEPLSFLSRLTRTVFQKREVLRLTLISFNKYVCHKSHGLNRKGTLLPVHNRIVLLFLSRYPSLEA